MQTLKRITRAVLILGLTITVFFSNAQNKIIPYPNVDEDWSKPYEPFRIVGNLYYVGTYDLACYLITTPQGDILINTGLAESVPMIQSNIEKLGFKMSDIKILLATHVHYDHVGGMAEIKKMTGAQMMIHENDAQSLADGGNSDYVMGGKGSMFAPVSADRLLHDHDTIHWGGMHVIVLHHPGHTKGACSYLFTVKDDHKSYKVLIANMPTIIVADSVDLSHISTYPGIVADYRLTLDKMKKLRFDIWLSSHASQFDLHEKHKPGDGYNPEAFIDRKGYDSEIARYKKAFLKRTQAK